MDEVDARDGAMARSRCACWSSFGVLAALLAAVGLVGLVSLSVALRRKELGIRAALGATPARLRRRMLTGIHPRIALAAVTFGTLASLLLGRLVKGCGGTPRTIRYRSPRLRTDAGRRPDRLSAPRRARGEDRSRRSASRLKVTKAPHPKPLSQGEGLDFFEGGQASRFFMRQP